MTGCVSVLKAQVSAQGAIRWPAGPRLTLLRRPWIRRLPPTTAGKLNEPTRHLKADGNPRRQARKVRFRQAATHKHRLSWQVTSHDEGRNALVTLYPDRIERVKAKAFGSLSRAHQDTEVIPIKAISSVQAKKEGFRTNVTVFASGNTVEFRIAHQEAQQFKNTVLQLILAGPPTPSAPSPPPNASVDIVDQIRKLGELRDQGLLTNEEFEARRSSS